MLPTLVRRLVENPIAPNLRSAIRAPLPGVYGRYKPKKIWPPDFSKLSQKEQFRFERRYKRRVKLATARPRWDKYVRLAQLSSVTFVAIYSILFMDWNTEKQPFEGVRNGLWNAIGALSPSQRNVRREPNLLAEESQK
ncbi:hypothetical protein F5Y15DRAFT_60493 [Xylariaceae sp. FL0016]|nr:hypothetical protein F5Y15DRAFT_60493 [Xylariaceae sp. FL0016]